jgi:hypothetical protein
VERTEGPVAPVRAGEDTRGGAGSLTLSAAAGGEAREEGEGEGARVRIGGRRYINKVGSLAGGNGSHENNGPGCVLCRAF